MKTSYLTSLYAIVILFQIVFGLDHADKHHTINIATTHITHRAYSSLESPAPTPTTKHHRYKQELWKMTTRHITRTLHTSLTRVTTRSPRPRYTTLHCSTTVARCHTAHEHKRPIHGNNHKKPTTMKLKHTKATATTHIVTTSSALQPQQTASYQLPVNIFLNNQLNTPTPPAFDVNILPTSTLPPPITTSDAPHSSTLAGSGSNDNSNATRSIEKHESPYSSFGSDLGLGVGCMAAAFILAGLLIYYRRRQQQRHQHRQAQIDDTTQVIPSFYNHNNVLQQYGKKWRHQTFVGADISELPRPSSSPVNDMIHTGIAIGSGHGAVELASQYLDQPYHSSPSPLVRISPHQY